MITFDKQFQIFCAFFNLNKSFWPRFYIVVLGIAFFLFFRSHLLFPFGLLFPFPIRTFPFFSFFFLFSFFFFQFLFFNYFLIPFFIQSRSHFGFLPIFFSNIHIVEIVHRIHKNFMCRFGWINLSVSDNSEINTFNFIMVLLFWSRKCFNVAFSLKARLLSKSGRVYVKCGP